MKAEEDLEPERNWGSSAPTPTEEVGEITGVSGKTQKGILLLLTVVGVAIASNHTTSFFGLAMAIAASVLLAGKVVAEAVTRNSP